MHIVGTAGHVDHGKSALIAALTGTNPDRLIEEQERGMTLDLGFAHLRFDDGVEGGVVDVPGHERFLHNMLAGAAGMELLLLVVDAVEGVMPQTLEHLQILQFLNVRRILLVVSKIDLVDPAQRDPACRRIREQLLGTIAQDAPLFAVSAETGENLDRLKAALHDELAAMSPRNPDAPVYLPVDRAFVLPGLGTVVTGTLMQGRIAAGETLALEPGGKAAHVRSIGVFQATRKSVAGGTRVALSVPGIDRREISRGQAIVGREFAARRDFNVRFSPLPDALGLLRRRTPVRAYVGSAEVLGTLVIAHGLGDAREVRAQLRLREAVVGFPGVRFVLRRPSPMTLLGGGYVEGVDVEGVDTEGPGEGRPADEESVLSVLRGRGLEAVELNAIAFATNLREDAARDAVDRLVEQGEIVGLARPAAYVDGIAARAMLAQMLATLDESHRAEPWAIGMTSIALARALGIPEPLFVRIAEHFVADGRAINRGGYYATVEHRPTLTLEQRTFFDHLISVDGSQPLLPIPFADAASAVQHAPVRGLARAFDTMLAHGPLVKVGDDLYRGSQIANLRARLEAHFRNHDRMTAAEFRDMLGTSRKYAMPLLEWLDAHGVTIRNGDYRTLRKQAIRS
ncbi:MAG TPA: selenocysteine-specific translation elongation factor [Candidatus Babeliales bacterium]|nr:selenocysteine-specific translation elongation factor [Candidatus Babeliales bacterium]